NGPTSTVTAMAFSPDGNTLYAGGWDKVVRVWKFQEGKWQPQPAFRVPLGPGNDGKLNALALSSDGKWLAAAGSGAVRVRAGFREVGNVLPAPVMNAAMRQDLGLIYVFNTQTRAVRLLRGHQGVVTALAFAPPGPKADKDEP